MSVFAFAQADTFAKTTAVTMVVLYVALIFARGWIASREEADEGNPLSGVLLALSAVALVTVVVAALAGPHPS